MITIQQKKKNKLKQLTLTTCACVRTSQHRQRVLKLELGKVKREGGHGMKLKGMMVHTNTRLIVKLQVHTYTRGKKTNQQQSTLRLIKLSAGEISEL
jgi:hypothetical protein